MKRYLYYLLIGSVVLGCQRAPEELPIPQGQGALQIELRLDNGVADPASKATVQDTYTMTADDLTASVVQGDKVLHTWDPMSAMPPVVYFEPGNYTLQVKTRGDRQTVNASPYYFGQTPFEITAGRTTSIYANASLQSLVVSMTLTGGWAAMTDYKLFCFPLDDPEQILFQTTDCTARLYIDTPFPYGLKIAGRIGGNARTTNVLVYDDLVVGTYHNLTISDQ